ncbi:MAG: lysophospholipid acyltransferase family protein [Candidatus Omnitrophica bacterium]|nr:lysophospholipid acyltransferase family protein [Candidatus Omnitrophota bacterium]MDD5553697.1 lysophospholipid acyltransferase family protein [Candidatus Omnitrophota bacterium]
MPAVKGILIFSSIFLYIICGLFTHMFSLLFRRGQRRMIISRLTRVLSRSIRSNLGIKLDLRGELSYFKEKGNFIVSNHLGYLDGIILSSLFPSIFVTKSQVRSWPVFGWMSRAGCTIYIDRKKKLGAKETVARISEALNEGLNVIFFPEGTSTDGSRILPFQQGYFQAPINSGTPVIPVTIQYTKINSENLNLKNRDKVCWYGQAGLMEHISGVLKQRSVEATITVHPKIEMRAYDPGLARIRSQISDDSLKAILRAYKLINS